jgi:NhaP-type Na+/H+ or K+/H+ antiporter
MDEHERYERHHYGVGLMVIGWIAIAGGAYMWQGKWPAIAAFGLGSLLWGLTLVLIAAMKEERSEPRGADEDRAARAAAKT